MTVAPLSHSNETSTRQLVERQTLLNEVLRAAVGQLDPATLAQATTAAIAQHARWLSVGISLLTPTGDQWQTQAAQGRLAPQTYGKPYPFTVGVIGRAYRTGQTQFVPDARHDPDYFYSDTKLISELAVPIKRDGQVLGVLNLESDRLADFTPEDIGLAEAIADALALALDNARLYAVTQREMAERQQAQAALMTSEAQYRLLFESHPNPMWVYEVETLAFLAVNAAAVQSYGYTRAEFLAMTINAIRPETEAAPLLAVIRETLPPSDGDGGLWKHRRKDGTLLDVEIRWSVLEFNQRPARLVLALDVTERLRTEEELSRREAYFRALVEHSSDALLLLDRVGRVKYVSPATQQVLGYAAEVFLYAQLWPLIHPEDVAALRAALAQAAEAPAQFVLHEYRLQQPDGTWRWLEGVGQSLLHDPYIQAIALHNRDITERKQAELALRDSEQRNRIISEMVSDFAYALQVNEENALTVEWMTQALFRMTGYTLEEITAPAGLQRIFHPDDWASFQQRTHRLLAGESDVREYRLLTQLGKARWIRDYGVPEWDEAHTRVIRIYGAAQDITARKQAEEALRDSERRFRIIFEYAGIGIALVNLEGHFLQTNGAFQDMVGYSDRDLAGRSIREVTHPDDVDSDRLLMGEMLAGQREVYQIEKRYRRADQQDVWGRLTASLVRDARGAPQFIIGMVENITERQRAEEALRASESRYRAIVEDQTDLICRRQPDGVLTFVNQAYSRYFGRTPASLVGQNFSPVIHPEDATLVADKRRALSPTFPTLSYWYRVILPNGETRWHQWTDRGLYNYAGELLEIQSVGQDITDRKRAEEALKRRNEELQALNAVATLIGHGFDLERLANAVLDKLMEILELDGGWIHLVDETATPPALRLVAQRGMPLAFLERASLLPLDGPLTSEADSSAHLNALSAAVRVLWQGEADTLPTLTSVPIQSKDKALGILGTLRYKPTAAPAVQEKQHWLATSGYQLGIAVENIRLAKQSSEIEVLRELDRLRSELIASVSHELRTPLGLITVSATTLLRGDVSFASDLHEEFLRDIVDEANRLEKIVDNLLDLSRMQSGRMRLKMEPIDMRQIARGTVETMQAQTTLHQLVCDLPSQPLVAVVDVRRIEQVLRNLLSNAIKYSPDGGPITVRGRGDVGVPRRANVILEVSDQGLGIAPKDLERIFEHFYRIDNDRTLNIPGAGLGLSVSRGIIEAHGGQIWAESQLGVGSTFYFTLPLGGEFDDMDLE